MSVEATVKKELAVLARERETGVQGSWYRCLDEAAKRIVAAHCRRADELRFLQTGGKRHYRVKGVDSRVALAGTAAVWFYIDEGEHPARVWWAFSNNFLDLSELERGSVALLKRKNELLDLMRSIASLMPDIRELALQLSDVASCGGDA